VSTAGSIDGTLGTTFFLIPLIGTRAITLLLGAAGIACALCLMVLDRVYRPGKAGSMMGFVFFAMLVCTGHAARAENLIDENIRAQMLKAADGRVAHFESEYNSIFINKHASLLAMTVRYKSESHFDSIVDLKDPDALPVPYTQIMPVALLYPKTINRILMVGLGAGSISTYLGRALPDAQIDVVELDPGVIAAGKKYFGLLETDKVHFIEGDGRVYLNRHKETYDLILLDAFREAGIPFQLLTREFYGLVKSRLAPGGAMASNLSAGTKLYLSSLITLRAVFPTVDIYPDWADKAEAQSILVAMPEPGPSTDILMRRAAASQEQRHFKYPMPDLAGKRVAEQNTEGGELLTDDFAPVNLYETMPIKPRKPQ
jgi:spermidine synthase